jgi:hypothetical protein
VESGGIELFRVPILSSSTAGKRALSVRHRVQMQFPNWQTTDKLDAEGSSGFLTILSEWDAANT